MAQRAEGFQVPSRAAADIEDRERRRAFDVPQERGDVLADVVVPGPGAEFFRAPLVMLERRRGNPGELGRVEPVQAATASFAAARIARAAASKAAGSGEATDTRRACASFGKLFGAERL